MRLERHIAFWIVALAVFVGLFWLLHHILLPFVVGAAIAYLLDPLANQLTKRGLNRLVAALLMLGAFVIACVGVFLLIAPVLINQLSSFIDHIPGYVQRLQSLATDPSHPWLKALIGSTAGGGEFVSALMTKSMHYLTGVLPSLWTKGEAILSVLSLLVITPVVAFYLLCDWNRVGQFLEGNVLSPKLVGESVGLHPLWLIFALLAGGYLFGFVGLLLAIPLAAAAGELTRFALQRYRASPLYNGKGST